ncbi:EAL domain-containing protein [Paenibacillus typhae]|uniref:PAS domain S-box-containing protein/diguanylate cyclase (GGDEF) domain-containing protein n=1 Tax=Paenibacillus typhae TaxID=1174501 RepID=A0A1G8I2G3_9BACL|nr:EAL domain-containing protein [Paenibacillus typhae]SDI12921.1 PAS domain S-box-containing protein/diguanylate cyclase (GGDEF) domain-containing protein [Paenibacillus typhae]
MEHMHMHGSHDKLLVFFSYLIAVAASCTVLELAGILGISKGRRRTLWLIFGAVIMGMGVWSMHFVGMLALKLPVPVAYNLMVVLLSMTVAVIASLVALIVISNFRRGTVSLLVGGLLLASGIFGMHYIGMSAMQIGISYRADYVVLSFVVALAASVVALGLSSQLLMNRTAVGPGKKLISGLVMGIAVVGMHYTGMLAASFEPESRSWLNTGVVLDQKWLAYVIAGGTLFTLGLSVTGVYISSRFSRKDTELLISEKWYRSLYENNQDAIISIDLNLRIIGSNPAATAISGISSKEFKEQSLDSLLGIITAEDQELIREMFIRSLAGEQVCYETAIMHENGKKLDVSINIAPVMVDGLVAGIYVIARDITEEKQAKEQTRYLAFHDELTGLPNRRMFSQLLSRTIEAHHDAQEPFAVLVMNVDRFKLINDTLGQLHGDRFLQEMSSRITDSVVNEQMALARLEGDEFALLCRFSREKMNVTDIVEQMLAAIKQPVHLNGRDLYVTASIGISFYPSHGQTPEELLKNAGTAMYEVKKNGRNDYQFFSDDLNGQIMEQLELESDLRKGLARGEFTVHYQPQIRTADNERIIGVEALVRWNHPVKGLLGPGLFIPAAEVTGRIVELGNFVLREACRQMRQWHDAGGPRIPVAVNLSSQQFLQYNLLEDIRDILRETGLAPEYLELEITESTMMDASRASAILNDLVKSGVRISLDDFGTGYSSLGYLKLYPIHKVKIDRSFISGISGSSHDRAIVATILTMAEHLGMQVIAEGIETKEQLDILVESGCRDIQGYYYSKPLAAEELERKYLWPAEAVGKIV